MKFYIVIIAIIISGCSASKKVEPDVQFVKVLLGYGCQRIDTFNKQFITSFVPDTVLIPIWFTQEEQKSILAKADSILFFNFAEILPEEHDGLTYRPNCFPAYIRIVTDDKDNTVIFFRSTTMEYKEQLSDLEELVSLIREIAHNKNEYKNHPLWEDYKIQFKYFDDL